jgi:flagellar hook-associated protein 1 FlgK
MSINSVMNGALSGLQASQAGIRATSNNVANVNTVGYARQDISFSGRVVSGVSAGVEVEQIRRVTDRFLVLASLNASSRAAEADVVAGFLDRAQATFGDPANGASVFDDLDQVFSSFAELTTDPTSSVRRSNVVADVEVLLNQFALMSNQIQNLRGEADIRIGDTVGRINSLLQDVTQLNVAVQRAQISGDATGAENDRDAVIDELAKLLDINVSETGEGILEVRTLSGILLAGQEASTINYQTKGVAAPGAVFSPILVTTSSGTSKPLDGALRGGELHGLLELRDNKLVSVASQISELAAQTVESLNAAHNQSTSFPPPAHLVGGMTSFRADDPLNVLGGPPATTQVVLTDAEGRLAETLSIDFTNQTITRDNGGAPVTIGFAPNTVQGLVNALDTAMAAATPGGSASFTNGRMTIDAGASARIAVVDPKTNAARIGDRGFAHAFALNNLIETTRPAMFATGLSAASPHGFGAGAGEEIALRFIDSTGQSRVVATINPVAGQTVGDLVNALNDPATGLGQVGGFTMPDANGRIQFQPNPGLEGGRLVLESDTTVRSGSSGVSFSDLFGVGEGAQSARATGLTIRSDIRANPASIALSRIDLTDRVPGEFVTGLGDGSGAELLFQSANTMRSFQRWDGQGTTTTNLRNFAAQVGAEAGRMASTAEAARASAETLRAEANTRLSSVEGVNVDEELVKLTAYQQAYNANSRMLQAANEMIDALLSIV